MKTIHVEVTQEDIEHGKRYMCRGCPVALALTRASGHECACGVQTAEIGQGPDCLTITLPDAAQQWIIRFDQDGRNSVHPFAFDIEVDL